MPKGRGLFLALSRDLPCDGAKQRPSWIILLTRHQTPNSTKGKGYQCKPGITEGSWDPESHPSVNQQLWGTCWLLSPHIPTLGIPCTNTSSLARWASGPHYHTTKLIRNSSALRIQSNPILMQAPESLLRKTVNLIPGTPPYGLLRLLRRTREKLGGT